MKRAVFFIASTVRETAIRMAMTLLVLATIWFSAKIVFGHYLNAVCISGFATFSQACIDRAAVLDPPVQVDPSRRSRIQAPSQ
jgi:hypothetical protein